MADLVTYRPTLSPRQRACLTSLANGCTHGQMAKEMGVNIRTVSRHIEDLRHRLGALNGAHAVHLAHVYGLLE